MRTMTKNVTVNKAAAAQSVQLIANVTSGAAPLTVNFSARTNLSTQVAKYEIDFEGKGSFTDCKTSFENIKHIYTLEKQYNVTLRVTDGNNVQYTDTIVLLVTAKDGLDALLRQKWEGMKSTFQVSNTQAASDLFVNSNKAAYKKLFDALTARLPQIATDMQSIQLVYIEDGVAQYRIKRIENGTTMTYYIYFAVDEDGVWRIKSF